MLYMSNTRMGMQASEINNRTCFELDVGGQFSNYTSRVETYADEQAILDPNMLDITVAQLTYNDQKMSEMVAG